MFNNSPFSCSSIASWASGRENVFGMTASKILTASPPCFVLLGLILTNKGRSTTPVTNAVPIGKFLISFSVSEVIDSTEFEIDFKSFGFVIFRIICVVAWEMQDLSTRDGLWEMMQRPNQNFLPSDEICLNIAEDFASPKFLSGR